MAGVEAISSSQSAGFDITGYAAYIKNLIKNQNNASRQTRNQTSAGNNSKDSVSISAAASKASQSGELTEEQKKQVDELKKTDEKVRAHEQAHLSAAGNLAARGASFEYESGPDGKKYAVGGEVQIDISPVSGDPEATIAKMQQVRRAALAPSDPSAQDRSVAAKASVEEAKARSELSQKTAGVNSGNKSDKSSASKLFTEKNFEKAYGPQYYNTTGSVLDLIVGATQI